MTSRHFAFLRAINTGDRRLTNAELLEPFQTLGLADVAAYQAAGNVTFTSDHDPEVLEPMLAETLTEAYGFETPVFVRSLDQARAAVDGLPFTPEQIERTEGRVQLTFLGAMPSESQRADVLGLVPTGDLVGIGTREWYWLPVAGVSTSELPVTRIERILGPMTMRTLGTVERMLAKYGS